MSQGIAAGDINTQFRKRFGTRGGGDLALSEEIIPVSNIADLDVPPWHFKQGFATGGIQVAGAGNFPYVGVHFKSSLAREARAVVRRIILGSAGTTQWVDVFLVRNIDIPVGVRAIIAESASPSWDSLFAIDTGDVQARAAITQVQINTNDVTFIPAKPMSVLCLTNAAVVVEGPFNLAPGNLLLARGQTAVTTLGAAFYGDEYLTG
jgi:hypothetical protein